MIAISRIKSVNKSAVIFSEFFAFEVFQQ